MSWFNQIRLFAIAATLGIAACGFTPLHGPNEAATKTRGLIEVAEVPGVTGFEMRRQLSELLGVGPEPTHLLTVSVSTSQQGLAITQESDITRFNITGTATYALTNSAAGVEVLTGEVRAFAAYSSNDAPFATDVAERDAQRRLAQSLSDQIATRITASADRWAP